MENKVMVIKPVVSEKSYALANSLNKYMFIVPTGANKIEVASAIEAAYKVKVEAVNSVAKPGKMKRDYKTYRFSRKSDSKKVFVTLKKGDKINDFFEVK
jgi:large subunit ribosomal protein L23